LFAFFITKNLFLKEKKRKKRKPRKGGGAWLQRSNAIKEGYEGGYCVYGGISLQPKERVGGSRLN